MTVCPTGTLSPDWLSPEDFKAIKQELWVTPKQAEQFLRGRRSIRTFKEQTVDRAILEKLLEGACSALSAKNQQPWHWPGVDKTEEVRRLAGLGIDWIMCFSSVFCVLFAMGSIFW